MLSPLIICWFSRRKSIAFGKSFLAASIAAFMSVNATVEGGVESTNSTSELDSPEAVSVWSQAVLEDLPSGLRAKCLLDLDATSWKISTEGGVTSEVIEVTDNPLFDKAMRVTVPKVFEQPWGATAHSPKISTMIPEGRVIFITVWIRAEVTQGGQSGNFKLFLERNQPDWESLGETGGTLDGNWRKMRISGVTSKDYPVDSFALAAHLGLSRQTLEMGPMTVVDVGPVSEVDVRDMPKNVIKWPGKEKDAPWRAKAEKMIEKHRMRALELTVLNAAGIPVEGANIEITQVKRSFSFGSFTGYSLLADTTNGPKMQDVYRRLFDRVTIPIYWADWGWLQQEERYVELAEWAGRQQPMDIRGHTLIYPGWRFMPTHMKAMKDYPEAFQAACLEQIRWVANRLDGVPFDELDVTNELRHLKEVAEVVGKDGIIEWFAEARRMFPGVKLCLNENTILTNSGDTQIEQDNFLGWYQFLKAHGQAPEVLGFQGHFSEGVTGIEDMWAILDRFAEETDAEIQITEYDLNTLNDEAQAEYTRDFLTAMFAHPVVTSVTLWGFWEGDHWIPNAANWRRDWTARPSADVLEELLGKTWRTNLKAKTDSKGRIQGKVFTGELGVQVSFEDGSRTVVPLSVLPGEDLYRKSIVLPWSVFQVAER